MSDSGQAQAARLPGGKLPRPWLIAAGALLALAVALALVLLLKGDDTHARMPAASRGASSPATQTASAHPTTQASAGATGKRATPVHGATGATGGKRVSVAEVADPEEANSFPSPASVHHRAAATPSKASEQVVAAGAPSDAEVKKELAQMQAVERTAKQQQKAQLTPVKGGNSVGGNGTIAIPSNVPETVQRVIAGANAITNFPYVFGGGHGSFVDNAYDCSGSVSYALAAGGLLNAPETSGELESWGAPGPGRYITVMAAAGHTYMYVDGVMYNTAGRSGPYASRWQVSPADNSGYVVRHWPGL
jgi:cell wall-associated NlpC family hydrolase